MNIKHLFKITTLVTFLFTYLLCSSAYAQDATINVTGIPANPSAILDIDASGLSPKKGLLIPRVTFSQRAAMNPLPTPAQGLVVYQTDQVQGFYYNESLTTSTSWAFIGDSSWSLSGNAGTYDGVNFIGTIDNSPLNFRWGTISQSGSTVIGYGARGGPTNTAFGFQSLFNNYSGQYNTAAGYRALYTFNNAVTGNYNTALGYTALYYTGNRNTGIGTGSVGRGGTDNTGAGTASIQVTFGIQNSSFGAQSLQSNTAGNYNTVAGKITLVNNTSGSYNTVTGTAAFRYNTIGSYNVGLGGWADASSSNISGNYKICIGYNSSAGTNNNAIAIGKQSWAGQNTIALGGINADLINVGVGVSNPNSRLEVQGSLSLAILATSANISLNGTMHTIIITGSGAIMLTLPTASSCRGRRYVIVNQSPVMSTTSTGYINYAGLSTTMIEASNILWIQSDGINWYQVR